MKLVVDVGNTNIVIALHNGKDWFVSERIKTKNPHAIEDFKKVIGSFRFDDAVVSSVVPFLNYGINNALESMGVKPLFISRDVKTGLDNSTMPSELGSDLICNMISGHVLFPDECVTIADFGTAFTTSTVDSDGKVLGVTISPGMMTSVKALYQNTAQIPNLRLDIPTSVLGKNTLEAVRAGVIYGFIGQLNAIVNEIEKELNRSVKLVVTGGFSKYVKPYLQKVDYTDLNLTINGALTALELNRR